MDIGLYKDRDDQNIDEIRRLGLEFRVFCVLDHHILFVFQMSCKLILSLLDAKFRMFFCVFHNLIV